MKVKIKIVNCKKSDQQCIVIYEFGKKIFKSDELNKQKAIEAYYNILNKNYKIQYSSSGKQIVIAVDGNIDMYSKIIKKDNKLINLYNKMLRVSISPPVPLKIKIAKWILMLMIAAYFGMMIYLIMAN